MKCLLLLFFVLSVNQGVMAQFNDSTFYQLRYATTGILNRTNEASSYAITNALRFSVSKKSIALNSNVSWVYGQQRERLTNNDFAGTLDVNWFRNNTRFYYWGLVNYESSYSLKVNNRTQLGAGIAYTLVESEKAFVNMSDGILYEFADLKVNDSTNDVYSTFRNSFRFRHRFTFNNRLVFDGSYFLQNSLQRNSDYIINATSNLSFKLMQWISLTSSLRYNKVNRNNRENLLLTFGVTAERYF